jgi:hypothetical protein
MLVSSLGGSGGGGEFNTNQQITPPSNGGGGGSVDQNTQEFIDAIEREKLNPTPPTTYLPINLENERTIVASAVDRFIDNYFMKRSCPLSHKVYWLITDLKGCHGEVAEFYSLI